MGRRNRRMHYDQLILSHQSNAPSLRGRSYSRKTNADVNRAKLNESFRTNSLVGPREACALLHFPQQETKQLISG